MGLYTLILSGVLILTCIVYFYFKRWQFFKNCKNIQTKPIVPLFGNILSIKNYKDVKSLALYSAGQEFKRTVIWYGPIPAVILQTADDFKAVAQSKNYNKTYEYEYSQVMGKFGIATCTMENGWKTERQLLNPLFRLKLIQQWIPSQNKHSQTLLQVLEKKVTTGEFFNFFPYAFRFATDAAIEFVAGIQWNAQINEDNTLLHILERFMHSMAYKLARPYLKYPPFSYIWPFTSAGKWDRKCLQDLYQYTEETFQRGYEKEESRTNSFPQSFDYENKNKMSIQDYEPLPILSYLKQAQEKDPQFWTKKRMDCVMAEMLFAASDTIDSAVTNLVYLLGCFPDAQEKAYEEIKLVFGDDKTRAADEKDLKKLNYLECCIKEGLRILPSAPIFLRELSSPLTLSNGDILPKNTKVGLLIYTLHRNPDVYPEPSKFKPERFDVTNAEAKNRSQYDFFAFSGGARGCIGMNMAFIKLKVVLSTILRNFRIESKGNLDDLEHYWNPVLKPTNAFVKLHSR